MTVLQHRDKQGLYKGILTTLVPGILTGVSYWIVLLAVSILPGIGSWGFRGILFLHALFSTAQGIIAFVVFNFATARLRPERLWRISVAYGLFLWAAGAAPLLVSDIAARYVNILPISIDIKFEIIRQISADVLLGLLCGFYSQLERRLRGSGASKELTNALYNS